MKKSISKVAIVGRANVGKSTLFNRLVEKNKALVSKISGTTRDRNIDRVAWRDREFEVIDTGGLDIDKTIDEKIGNNIVRQANMGIKSADLILFMINIKDGLMPADQEIAKELIKQNLKKKIILVANKADSPRWRQANGDLYKLGLGEPQFISAASGSSVGDLLDLVLERLPTASAKNQIPATARENIIKIAITGRPNVGKSSILNSILGEERVMVTDVAHTTREAHDAEFEYGGQHFVIIDTAGIRKHSRIVPGSLERKSVDKSLEALRRADIILLVTEVQNKIDVQDKKITQEILEAGKSLIIIANKWDLIPDKDTATINNFTKSYRISFPYLWWAPILFISAKENLRTKKILELALEVQKSRDRVVPQEDLDKFLKSKLKKHKPSRGKGLKNPYIFKIEQVGTRPPKFLVFVNDPMILHFSYIRFLQNHLREEFDIMGTPIQIELRKQNQDNNAEKEYKSNKSKKPQNKIKK
ncbi:MAG: ribosome biogenesis GTPase Der [bacterium]